jgi:hypothetical protein
MRVFAGIHGATKKKKFNKKKFNKKPRVSSKHGGSGKNSNAYRARFEKRGEKIYLFRLKKNSRARRSRDLARIKFIFCKYKYQVCIAHLILDFAQPPRAFQKMQMRPPVFRRNTGIRGRKYKTRGKTECPTGTRFCAKENIAD